MALGLQVLQTLYSCQPFRERLLQYAAGPATREAEETILSCLADLFLQVRAMTAGVKTNIQAELKPRNNNSFNGAVHH